MVGRAEWFGTRWDILPKNKFLQSDCLHISTALLKLRLLDAHRRDLAWHHFALLVCSSRQRCPVRRSQMPSAGFFVQPKSRLEKFVAQLLEDFIPLLLLAPSE